MKTIVISACTYKRPDGLDVLLSSLKELRVPSDVSLCARIVDNEETPEAQTLVKRWSRHMPFPLYYVHEPDAGIAPARNRALCEANAADFLVFVDDDETVSPQWIEELWRMQKQTSAQFVQGSVKLTVEDPSDEWFLRSKLFFLKEYPDGAPRHEAWSNNVMIDMVFVREHGLHFDPKLRFDGGEDTLFFQQLCRKGGNGVFAAKADVYEVQPKSRLNWKWALARQFRNGNSRAMIAKRQRSKTGAIAHCVLRAGACAGVGILLLPLALFKGRIGLANALTYIARSFGVLYGLFGKRYKEYAR